MFASTAFGEMVLSQANRVYSHTSITLTLYRLASATTCFSLDQFFCAISVRFIQSLLYKTVRSPLSIDFHRFCLGYRNSSKLATPSLAHLN